MNPVIQNIAKTFTNKKLKKIVNVYKLHYRNGSSPGLGDYLRGSFAFMQLSYLLNIEFDIDISQHPMAKFIENPVSIEGLDYSTIDMYDQMNRKQGNINNYENVASNINIDFLHHVIHLLNNQDCETYGLFSNAFTCFNYYSSKGREFIKSRLRPTKYIQDYVDETLASLNLTKKNYSVIHIRSGDKYLLCKDTLCTKFVTNIKNILDKNTFSDRKYIIISDCTLLKHALKTYPNFYIYLTKIAHLGGETAESLDLTGVRNTMLDFFIMEHSVEILSLSVYGHVSGFSKYARIINDIPFKYIKLDFE